MAFISHSTRALAFARLRGFIITAGSNETSSKLFLEYYSKQAAMPFVKLAGARGTAPNRIRPCS